MTTLTLSRPYAPVREEVERALAARKHLIDFGQWVMPAYRRAPHLALTAEYLEAVERGEIRRLMIEEPPQHGKSLLDTVLFPAYALAKQPTRRIITASYGDILASTFGRQTRNFVDSEACRELFPGVSVASDSKAANLWHTPQGGRLLAVGVGGGVTGHGADILLIDDPVKSREEAESQTYRDKVWDWYKAEAYTRLSPEGAVVLTMTRWHEDDLAGRLLAGQDSGDKWTVLRLPALADDLGDPLGRALGEPLPGWYSLEDYERIKAAVGERDWNALYQQRPSPAEGAIFKWWSEYDRLADIETILLPIDTAYTEKERADYTAVSAWAVTPGHIDLMGARRWQLETPKAEVEIFKLYWELRNRYPNVAVTPLVRKRVAIDRVLAQHLRARKIPVVEVDMPSGNTKTGLANMVVNYFESGVARVPANKPPWFGPWHSEHLRFDNDVHDDYVETTIIALHHYRGYRPVAVPDINVRFDYGENGNGHKVPRFKQRNGNGVRV